MTARQIWRLEERRYRQHWLRLKWFHGDEGKAEANRALKQARATSLAHLRLVQVDLTSGSERILFDLRGRP